MCYTTKNNNAADFTNYWITVYRNTEITQCYVFSEASNFLSLAIFQFEICGLSSNSTIANFDANSVPLNIENLGS